MKQRVPAIAVRFDKISIVAAQAIRESGGTIQSTSTGRYLYTPHSPKCRWGGPLGRQTMKLPDDRKIVCISHDESVELVLDTTECIDGHDLDDAAREQVQQMITEIKQHVAEVKRQQITKRMQYGKAAKKGQREQQH